MEKEVEQLKNDVSDAQAHEDAVEKAAVAKDATIANISAERDETQRKYALLQNKLEEALKNLQHA